MQGSLESAQDEDKEIIVMGDNCGVGPMIENCKRCEYIVTILKSNWRYN